MHRPVAVGEHSPGSAPPRRDAPSCPVALTVALVVAPVALGHDGGEGTYGETDDKVVTNAGFILIAVFPLLILLHEHAPGRARQAQGPPQGGRQGAPAARTDVRGGW